MQNWTDGYITEIEYTSGFYPQLAPTNMNFAALLRGFASPDAAQAYTWLDIGCGQGLTTNALAASNPQSEFFAFDFNPVHIQNAQRLVKDAAIKNVTFFEDSFEGALNRDLPPMDYIVLHGIYSWVSREHRAQIVALIRKLLKPEGMVYVSYNCLPGWGSKAPLRRLMVEYASRRGRPTIERIQAARDFVGTLKQAGTRYFAKNPQAQEMAESIVSENVTYLAHEYLNEEWDLFYHSDVAADMNEAKLTFAASATLLENSDESTLTPQAVELLRKETDPVMRELLRDFALNQQFRRDLYIRGARRLGDDELVTKTTRLRLCLLQPRKDCVLEATIPAGEFNLAPAIYEPILDALATGPKTVRELAEASNAPLSEFTDAVTMLCYIEYAHLMVDEPHSAAATSCKAFNAAALDRAVAGEKLDALAASNLGNGVYIGLCEQFFLYAHMQKIADPVAFAWDRMKALNHRFRENGERVEGEAENLKELHKRAARFAENMLPLYKIWGVIP